MASYCPCITEEKSPSNHSCVLCTIPFSYAKNVEIALRILPNIKPTNGIKTVLRNLILLIKNMNRKEVKNVKSSAKIILTVSEDCGKRIRAVKIPIFAASKDPEVVGETNLFCDNCCKIKPDMLNPAPTNINAKVLGIRLITKNSIFSLSENNSE